MNGLNRSEINLRLEATIYDRFNTVFLSRRFFEPGPKNPSN